MATLVATVVALRDGRVLLVEQDGALALPGGKVEEGETPLAAARRELAEETAIELAEEDLTDLGERIEAGHWTLVPFATTRATRAAGPLRASWVRVDHLVRERLAPGVPRSVHAACRALGEAGELPPALPEWWLEHRGALPWRATRDPYAILVCEVMSHQTQIQRVASYWERWLARWPTVEACAAAPLADVLREWQGLGYPRRARDLHAAAAVIARDGWPERLSDLPGVGPYTADALRCFAFGEPVIPLDANVRRVLARRFPGGLAAQPDAWSAGGALMDLGRIHCRARRRCEGCPLSEGCLVRLEGSGWDPAAPAPRQAPYRGSLRARRGELLRLALAGERPPRDRDAQAAASLLADGLLAEDGGALVPPRSTVGTRRRSS
jgi:A/G-specific adenine glycosylase